MSRFRAVGQPVSALRELNSYFSLGSDLNKEWILAQIGFVLIDLGSEEARGFLEVAMENTKDLLKKNRNQFSFFEHQLADEEKVDSIKTQLDRLRAKNAMQEMDLGIMQVHLVARQTFYQSIRPEEAEKLLQNVSIVFAKHGGEARRFAQYYYSLGLVYRLGEKYDEALQTLAKAHEIMDNQYGGEVVQYAEIHVVRDMFMTGRIDESLLSSKWSACSQEKLVDLKSRGPMYAKVLRRCSLAPDQVAPPELACTFFHLGNKKFGGFVFYFVRS